MLNFCSLIFKIKIYMSSYSFSLILHLSSLAVLE
uniref:Uncharacterized protein n=1 Tax=Arundo donax TaxID=35708 RepID=A0A0A8YVB8_ARUDO